jgi:hypothetical protein
VRGILASYRWRRRILWTVPFLVAAIAFAVLIASLPRENSRLADDISGAPTNAEVPEQVPQIRRPVRVTGATRREVDAVLTAFVRHAVVRENPAEAWNFATPALKAGQTREQWRRGDLPVYPFPVKISEAKGWRVVESFEDDLIVSVLMHARPGTNAGAIAYQVELKRLGRGENRRWLVDAFIPERVYTPPSRNEQPERAATPQPSSVPSARLSPWWFVVPGILLSLIVLVPLSVVVVSWRRGVRAEKAYLRSLAEDRETSAP